MTVVEELERLKPAVAIGRLAIVREDTGASPFAEKWLDEKTTALPLLTLVRRKVGLQATK